MVKGVAYFSDGNKEPIVEYTTYTREGPTTYIEFRTSSGWYAYKETIVDNPMGMKHIAHEFIKITNTHTEYAYYTKADIESITLDVQFPPDHRTI